MVATNIRRVVRVGCGAERQERWESVVVKRAAIWSQLLPIRMASMSRSSGRAGPPPCPRSDS